MAEQIDFHTWFHNIDDTQFTAIILPIDTDEVTVECWDQDWYLCHQSNPPDLMTPFIIGKGTAWTVIPSLRRTDAGTIIGYARSLSGSGVLRCLATIPPPGVL